MSSRPAVVADTVSRADPRRVQRRVLGTLTVTQVVGGSGVTIGISLSTLVAARMSGSDAIGGLAQTSAVLGSGLLAIPAARLAARRGRRPALLLGYGTATLGAAVAALAVALGWWPLLLGGLLLFGGGSTAGLAARYAATDLAAPDQRARALSVVVWCTTIGAVAGPNLAAPADEVGVGLGLPAGAGPYLLSMSVFGLAAVGVVLGLRPDPLVVARSVAPERSRPTGARRRGATWRVLGPRARLALGAIVLCHTAMVGLMAMTPVHMGHGDASLQVVGIVISVHVAGMYAFSPVFGWLADRVGRVPVLSLGVALIVAAAAVAGTAQSHDAPQLGVGLTLLGLGWSAGLVSSSTLLTESVPLRDRPTVQGLSDLLMNLGGAAGGLVAGVVVTAASYGVLALVMGVAALPLLVVSLLAALRPATR